ITTFSTTTTTFGALKSSMLMAAGPTPTTTAGSGGRIQLSSITITTGHPIVTAAGAGFSLTAGPGWATNPGVGLLITMAAGSTTTATGPGAREAFTTGIAAGGGRRWWLFTSHLATTFVGIRCTIINAIRVRVTTEVGAMMIACGRCVRTRARGFSEAIQRSIAPSHLFRQETSALMESERDQLTKRSRGERSMPNRCEPIYRSARRMRPVTSGPQAIRENGLSWRVPRESLLPETSPID